AFKGTNDSVLMAMGENISPGYTNKTMNPWPARGRGFNSGLILFHLERMRKANWRDMWRKDLNERLKQLRGGADQDILNAMTITYPEMAVELPCEYNFQIGEFSEPLGCLKNDRFVKIVHFNSQEKTKLKNRHAVYFARSHNFYRTMDGNIFRKRDNCAKDNSTSTNLMDLSETEISCDELYVASQTRYRTQLYFNGFQPSNETGDVTLVT
ncbi:hypothetical protein PENTCL1PPCAC_29813, partial [Pristionchus entomophagus]